MHTPHLHHDGELSAGDVPGSGLATAAVAVGVSSAAIEDGAKFVDSFSSTSTAVGHPQQ